MNLLSLTGGLVNPLTCKDWTKSVKKKNLTITLFSQRKPYKAMSKMKNHNLGRPSRRLTTMPVKESVLQWFLTIKVWVWIWSQDWPFSLMETFKESYWLISPFIIFTTMWILMLIFCHNITKIKFLLTHQITLYFITQSWHQREGWLLELLKSWLSRENYLWNKSFFKAILLSGLLVTMTTIFKHKKNH